MDNQIKGNIGLYYLSYVLSKNGLNVLPTSRNARGIDLVAYRDNNNKRPILLQIKTISNGNAVPIGNSFINSYADYWAIVDLRNLKQEPYIYVMNLEDVKKSITKNEKNGKTSLWLEKKSYVKDEYREKLEEIIA